MTVLGAIIVIAPPAGIAQPRGTPPESASPPPAEAPEKPGMPSLPGEPTVTSPFGPFGAFGPLAPVLPPAAPGTVGPSGLYLSTTFSVEEEFNDNIFSTSTGREWDFITRFTPGLTLGYRSEPLTVEAGYAFSSEVFARNSELNDAFARQLADRHRAVPLPTRLLRTRSGRGSYLKTERRNNFPAPVLARDAARDGPQTAEGDRRVWHDRPLQFTSRLRVASPTGGRAGEVEDGPTDTSNTGSVASHICSRPSTRSWHAVGFGFFDTRAARLRLSENIMDDITSQYATPAGGAASA